jgi:hypothetical protein
MELHRVILQPDVDIYGEEEVEVGLVTVAWRW